MPGVGGEASDRAIPDRALLERLRALDRGHGTERRSALQGAEHQAALLLSTADVSGPPVTESVLMHVPAISVCRWKGLPRQAMLVPDGTRWQIVINAEDDEREQLFSALHEIKHLIDAPHHPPGDGRAGTTPVEGVCEHFAACVLMPAVWLRRDWHDGQREVAALARRYRVSAEAMRDRLADLRLRPDLDSTPPLSRCRNPRPEQGGTS